MEARISLVDSGDGFPCLGMADDFVDYSVAPSNEDAEIMCFGCPIFDLCDDYASQVSRPSWGIWAGRVWKNRRALVNRRRAA